MIKVGQILCKTVGVAGMGLAMYDAVNNSKVLARKQSLVVTQNWLEDSFYDSRTLDHISASSNAIRKKTFDLRTKNPIPALVGKIKGSVTGFFYGLGINLPTIACSALAILSKGTLSKIGATGVAFSMLYKVAREGFGLGKKHPMS